MVRNTKSVEIEGRAWNPSPRAHGLVVGLLASCLAGGLPARADDADLSRLEREVTDLSRRTLVVEQQVSAGGGVRAEGAVDRFEEAVYRYLIGDHDVAAESLLVLVTSGAMEGTGLQRDAEWYLGQALDKAGQRQLAEGVYAGVARNKAHPFRDDAVLALLTLYAADPDPSRFDRLFGDEILAGNIDPTDDVLYVVGKAFRLRGDVAKAKGWFERIEAGSSWYARARYFIGAMLVAQGDDASKKAAVDVFSALSELEVDSAVDREVRDLAILALGRIYDHTGLYAEAVEAYGRVSDDSAVRADKLYELAWVHIKQAAYSEALDAVEAFLATFPDHELASELRLVQGHLRFEIREWDQAIATYEALIADYEPIVQRFRDLSMSTEASRAFLDELDKVPAKDDPVADLATNAGEAGPMDTAGLGLPPFAVSTMLADPEFRRARALYDEVQSQRRMLAASEEIVRELEGPLGGGSLDELIRAARLTVLEGRVASLSHRLELAAVESAWISGRGGAALSGSLASLDQRRRALLSETDALTNQVASLRAGGEGADSAALARAEASVASSLPRLEAEAGTLWESHRALRSANGNRFDLDPQAARVDRLHESIMRSHERIVRVGQAMEALRGDEFARLRQTFAVEAQAVAGERTDLDRVGIEADLLAGTAVRDNFQRVSDMFMQRVMGADMGIVNVAWSRWVEVGEERDRLKDEQNAVLAELAEKYGFVEGKVKP